MARRTAAIAIALVASCGGTDGLPVGEPAGDGARSRPVETGGLAGGAVLQTRSTRGALDGFDNDRAMRDIRALANGIGPRVRATTRERRAARFVARRLRSLGYRVRIRGFPVDGGRSRNVVAWWPTARRHRVLVGAHIDTVRGSPGANDNASGVAVMLENARIFAGRRQARWLRFIAFGSEEYGHNGAHHVGSQTFVRRLGRDGRRRVAGMISVDMVADGKPLIVGSAGIGPPRMARTLHRHLVRAGVDVAYRTVCDCSDNGPFERAGIPAAFMWSDYEPSYHDDSDRPGNLQPGHVRRSGIALRYFLRRVDKQMVAYLRNS